MSAPELRRAGPADTERLVPLYRAFFDEDGITTPTPALRRNLARMLEDERACILLAEAGGVVLGLAAGSLTHGVEFGCAAELEDLYVLPDARGRGLARRLAAAVLDWAEDAGATEVYLVITPEAEADRGLTRFYGKLGFARSGRITMFREPGDG
ncbi:GNAT family N-acetyltransferase [Oceanicola sp. S124]|uniref:GNAT family N-acetyltransferase n=1 Tax=Oceanicola sp. S124 TaxID=1042378 RepID=UPI0002557AA8|nr:GNAT family N-acetyltransferase [Oceanicola sp. S124]